MTPEQLERVAATVSRLEADGSTFANAFYDELFRRLPDARSLFPDDMGEQRAKLVDELTFLVGAVRDLDGLVDRARELGVRHHGYGVRPAHYRTVEHALLAGMAAVLGDDLDATTEAAWRSLYWLIAETMLEGASSAVLQ
jgi:hemoglobin-like flavoprotein